MTITEQEILIAAARRRDELDARIAEFKKRAATPITEEEKARRRAIFEEFKRARERLPSIAPDTTGQYIRETRDELDAESDHWR